MSPRSLRLLESSLVSAFVAFGVASAVVHSAERTATVVAQERGAGDVLAPVLRAAVEADAALRSDPEPYDRYEAQVYRVESLYRWYAEEHQKLAATTKLDWAQKRADSARQLQEDFYEMKKLEAEAIALEARQRGAD